MRKKFTTQSNVSSFFNSCGLFTFLFTFILIYSATAENWAQKSDMPIPRLFFSVTTVDSQLYTIGGMLAEPVDFVEAYDPDKDEWTQKASLPAGRAGVVTGVVDGKIYVIGGWNGQSPALGTVEEYDPATDTWMESPEMPTARVFLGAGNLKNKIYAVGGVAEGLGPAILATVEEFAPSLSVTPRNRFITTWGEFKKAN